MQETFTELSLRPIATISSCYPQRFGVPRQAGLVKSATASIDFAVNRDNELSLRDLDTFSHLWIVFVFHKQNYSAFKPLVQPPRLGGKKTMGVYATRSPNRVNPIGLSAVQLERIEHTSSQIKVHILGGDFLDGTPVLDIKPYVPFADSLPHASAVWAASPEPPLTVCWSETATAQLLESVQQAGHQLGQKELEQLIDETIAQDPRPAYERNKDGKAGQTWGVRVAHVDVKWQVRNAIAEIVSVVVV